MTQGKTDNSDSLWHDEDWHENRTGTWIIFFLPQCQATTNVWKYTSVISVKLPGALHSSVLIFSPQRQWENARSTQWVKYQWVNKTPLLLAIRWGAYRNKHPKKTFFHRMHFFFFKYSALQSDVLFQIKDNIYERAHHLITIAVWNRHLQPQQHQQQQLTGSFCVSSSIADHFD